MLALSVAIRDGHRAGLQFFLALPCKIAGQGRANGFCPAISTRSIYFNKKEVSCPELKNRTIGSAANQYAGVVFNLHQCMQLKKYTGRLLNK
jgi:hypothetical protein